LKRRKKTLEKKNERGFENFVLRRSGKDCDGEGGNILECKDIVLFACWTASGGGGQLQGGGKEKNNEGEKNRGRMARTNISDLPRLEDGTTQQISLTLSEKREGKALGKKKLIVRAGEKRGKKYVVNMKGGKLKVVNLRQ